MAQGLLQFLLMGNLKHPHLGFVQYAAQKMKFSFNPIQDRGGGRGAKRPPTSFSAATSANVEVSPRNFLTFSFNPFATLV